jgi:flavin-dependent dehydrogenase
MLARWGARVALIDKARFPRNKACAEYLNPAAMLVLERLGLLPAVRAAGAAAFNGMRVVSPGGYQVTLDYTADANRYALGLSRWKLDQIAIERCQALGVSLFEGARVRDVHALDGGPTSVTVSQHGKSFDLTCRVLVGADGHHSAVSRLLGLDVPMRWPRRIGLAAHVEGFTLAGQMGEMHVGAVGYCGIAPQESDRVNVAMVVEMERFERRTTSVDAFFDTALRTYPLLADRLASSARVTQVRGVGPLARRVRRVYGEGFLLVGDAAGFFDPFTGEGIYDALRGGELAAATIADALERGDFSAGGLASYEEARRHELGAKRRANWLVQTFVRYPAMMDYAIRRLSARPVEAATMTGVLGNYRDADALLSPWYLWRVLRP